jgi:hypothetical protein
MCIWCGLDGVWSEGRETAKRQREILAEMESDGGNHTKNKTYPQYTHTHTHTYTHTHKHIYTHTTPTHTHTQTKSHTHATYTVDLMEYNSRSDKQKECNPPVQRVPYSTEYSTSDERESHSDGENRHK